jgi:hypothetical protein
MPTVTVPEMLSSGTIGADDWAKPANGTRSTALTASAASEIPRRRGVVEPMM